MCARISVATCLRCDWIFNDEFIANLAVSILVKKCGDQSTFDEVMGNSIVACFFIHSVQYDSTKQ